MKYAVLCFASVVFAAGCHSHAGDGEGHDHEDDHHSHGGHDHGPAAIGITEWTDELELYAEHPPAVVGQEVPFLAHLTVLDGFRALEDARVRLALTGPAELTAEAPMLRPGIYRPTFTATAPGTYQGTLTIIDGGEGTIGPFAVEVYPSQEAADAANPADERGGGAVSFLKEQQWRVSFDTAFAARGTVRPSVGVSGELTTPPGGVAHVHAPVGGRVMAGRSGFPLPGQAVQAGALLATIAPTPGAPEDAARADLAVVEAQAQVEAGRTEVERAERMVADQAIPERRLAEARRQLQVAEASLSAARRAQSMYASAESGRGRGSWRITAPIAGIVDAVEVSPGEAVDANELLFRVVDPNTLWVSAEVPESWAGRFVRDANASFQLVGEDRWHPIALEGDGSEAHDTLVHASRTVDPTSRTVRVVYALGEPDESLRVGAALRVLIPVGEAVEAVTVPRSAVLDVEGRSVVYVQAEGESFEERVVRLGPSEGDRVAVTSGVEEGERIVTRGAHLVRLAGSSGAVGHGHVH